jgi:hypothetical protein
MTEVRRRHFGRVRALIDRAFSVLLHFRAAGWLRNTRREGQTLSQLSTDDSASITPQTSVLGSPSSEVLDDQAVVVRKGRAGARNGAKAKAELEDARIQKLLNSTVDFNFNTLISGVSTINQPRVTEEPHSKSRLPTPLPIEDKTGLLPGINGVPEASPYTTISSYSGKFSLAPPEDDPVIVGPGPLESHQAHVEHVTSHPKGGIAYVTRAGGSPLEEGRRAGRLRILVIITVIVLVACSAVLLNLYKPEVVENVQSQLPFRVGVRASFSWLRKGLPDPRITPGDRDLNGTRPTPISADSKLRAFKAYGVDPQDKHFQVTRLIPASLSGTNQPENLFVISIWYAGLKVRVDKAIADKVHSGTITAEQAEEQLKSNWLDAIHKPYLSELKIDDSNAARNTLSNLK